MGDKTQAKAGLGDGGDKPSEGGQVVVVHCSLPRYLILEGEEVVSNGIRVYKKIYHPLARPKTNPKKYWEETRTKCGLGKLLRLLVLGFDCSKKPPPLENNIMG